MDVQYDASKSKDNGGKVFRRTISSIFNTKALLFREFNVQRYFYSQLHPFPYTPFAFNNFLQI